MKVTYLIHHLGPTGGNMVLYAFMDRLVERGYSVHVTTPDSHFEWRSDSARQLISGFHNANTVRARFVGATMDALRRLPYPRRTVRRLLQTDPSREVGKLTKSLLAQWVPSDVTIATYHLTAYAAYLLADKSMAFYHMQHYEPLFFDDNVRHKRALLTYYLPISLLTNSTWLRENIRRETGRDSELLLPGIDRKVFTPANNISAKYSGLSRVRVVTYYSDRQFKGWSDGVAAMRTVFTVLGYTKVEWVVYGGFPPIVSDVPFRSVGSLFGEDLAQLYSSAHIVFMPSWYESFPLPPLEAMACGTAVVFTGTGAEDYAVDGRNAIVIPARDPDLLAQAIISLATSPGVARGLAEEGFLTAQRHDWGPAVDRLEDILHSAAGR
jgi:glycosyltransferase involved in cell wall biosynthesis